jgi:hypothetical protein
MQVRPACSFLIPETFSIVTGGSSTTTLGFCFAWLTFCRTAASTARPPDSALERARRHLQTYLLLRPSRANHVNQPESAGRGTTYVRGTFIFSTKAILETDQEDDFVHIHSCRICQWELQHRMYNGPRGASCQMHAQKQRVSLDASTLSAIVHHTARCRLQLNSHTTVTDSASTFTNRS